MPATRLNTRKHTSVSGDRMAVLREEPHWRAAREFAGPRGVVASEGKGRESSMLAFSPKHPMFIVRFEKGESPVALEQTKKPTSFLRIKNTPKKAAADISINDAVQHTIDVDRTGIAVGSRMVGEGFGGTNSIDIRDFPKIAKLAQAVAAAVRKHQK